MSQYYWYDPVLQWFLGSQRTQIVFFLYPIACKLKNRELDLRFLPYPFRDTALFSFLEDLIAKSICKLSLLKVGTKIRL